MIEISPVRDARRFRKIYFDLVRRAYGKSPHLRTSVHGLAMRFLSRDDPYTRRCVIRPLLCYSSGRSLAAAILIKPPEATFVAVAFFEACGAVEASAAALLEAACEFARENGVRSVIAGLNGHVSYGVGYLQSHFEELPAFDTAYNPPEYPAAWEALGPSRVHRFHSYRYNVEEIRVPTQIVARAARRFTVRCADLSRWTDEVGRLTEILNENASAMPLYQPKTPVENAHLMGGLNFLLKPEHLLFLQDKLGRDVGFLFWHPDFNEALGTGQGSSALGLFVASRFRSRRITRFVVNTLAVRPALHGSGGIFLLVDAALRANRFPRGESCFISRDNRLSTALGPNVNGIPWKSYAAYEFSTAAS